MEHTSRRFTKGAATLLWREIRSAGGREIMLAGGLNASRLVANVRVVARGSYGAVPVPLEAVEPGEVVVHNHPGGDLSPSDADLDVACVCAEGRCGCYVVNNVVTHVNVLVEPFGRSSADVTEADRVTAILSRPFASLTDASAAFGVPRSYIVAAFEAGEVAGHRVGRRRFINLDSLRAHLGCFAASVENSPLLDRLESERRRVADMKHRILRVIRAWNEKPDKSNPRLYEALRSLALGCDDV